MRETANESYVGRSATGGRRERGGERRRGEKERESERERELVRGSENSAQAFPVFPCSSVREGQERGRGSQMKGVRERELMKSDTQVRRTYSHQITT